MGISAISGSQFVERNQKFTEIEGAQSPEIKVFYITATP